MKLLQYNKTRK